MASFYKSISTIREYVFSLRLTPTSPISYLSMFLSRLLCVFVCWQKYLILYFITVILGFSLASARENKKSILSLFLLSFLSSSHTTESKNEMANGKKWNWIFIVRHLHLVVLKLQKNPFIHSCTYKKWVLMFVVCVWKTFWVVMIFIYIIQIHIDFFGIFFSC